MVTNFKLFTPGKALQPGTLWVVEEIPGLVAGGDQTATLARGYVGRHLSLPSCVPSYYFILGVVDLRLSPCTVLLGGYTFRTLVGFS